MGIDEAYADLTGVEKPLRVLRELIAQVKKATGSRSPSASGRSRLVAKCCSDLGKPAGFVAMGREEACIRFAPAPTRRLPGIGPKTAERLAELGYAHRRPAPGGRRGAARRAVGKCAGSTSPPRSCAARTASRSTGSRSCRTSTRAAAARSSCATSPTTTR